MSDSWLSIGDVVERTGVPASALRFYEAEGLARLAARLRPGGVFGLWSDGATDEDFLAIAESVFSTCVAHTVAFPNFYTGEESSSTVYVATVDQVC